MKLKRISLNVREQNIYAIKCYQKCGFTITCTYPKKFFLMLLFKVDIGWKYCRRKLT
ncbi:MAG: hypothetical protein ACOWWR_17270 [Eubacteriales bacterium]